MEYFRPLETKIDEFQVNKQSYWIHKSNDKKNVTTLQTQFFKQFPIKPRVVELIIHSIPATIQLGKT